MRRAGFAAVAATVAVLMAGCSSNAPGELSSSAAQALRPAVEQVRQAAASGKYSELSSAVQQLKDQVKQQERDGQVTSQRATAIEDAADVLLQDARPSPSPTPTSTSPSPSPTSASPTPSETPTATPTSASPTPTQSSPSPIVSISAGGGSPHSQPTP